MRRTLDDVLSDRGNSLTPIRLGLAAMVLVAHTASISGLAEHPLVGGVGLGTWAVMAFFTVSGYLVTQSRDRLSLRRFLLHRGARILPAFWVANLVTALVLAPVAALIVGSRVDWADALLYPLRNGLLVMNQWSIDGSLTTAPYSDVWNGSLWTLAQEAGWYLVVGAAFLLAVLRRNLPATAALLLVTTTALNVYGVPWSILGAFFAAGMLLYGVRDRLPVTPWLLALAAVLCVVAGVLHEVVLVAPLPLAYLVLAGSSVRMPGAGARADLSYGVYIYAFPVAQLLVVLEVQRLGLVVLTLATSVLTLGAAALSWRYVEAPALRALRGSATVPTLLRSLRARATFGTVGAPGGVSTPS